MSIDKNYKTDMKDYIKRVFDGKINTSLKDGDLEILKKKMLRSIENDTQQLVSAEKFISGLILRMPVIPVRDCRVNTAMTDGTNIYFDIDFYTKLNQQERVFVLAHEVWHNALLHFLRRENRIAELWNIATDCEINYALKNDGFKVPNGLCLPSPADQGKCAEDIYDHLLAMSNRNQKQNSNSSQSDYRNGSTGKGFSISDDSKSNSESFNEQFDQHCDKSSQSDEYGEGGMGQDTPQKFKSPHDKWGEKGFDKDFKPCITDDIADKIREMVIAEAQRCERTRGSIPGSILRVIETICKPEIKWEEYLAQFVTSCLGDRRQWLPPQRRGVYNEMYFQSRRGQKINVACIVDTSGSTSGDLPKFLSETISLLETFGRYELSVIHCDCEVHRVDVFDDSNPFPIDNPSSYTFDGGGGSSLVPAFDEIINRGMDPTCIVVFTDGYIECPSTNPTGIPTMFVLTSDGDENLSDWGTKVKFKSSN
jgi:predicted metal-dependent peptidase